MDRKKTSDQIYIKKSKIKNAGRGVFAGCDIKKGEVVEDCPIIELSEYDTEKISGSSLISYVFFFGKGKKKCAIALGYGSLYNYSDKPNLVYELNEKKRVITFTAIKNIKKDTELTFNYRGGSKSKDPLWFE